MKFFQPRSSVWKSNYKDDPNLLFSKKTIKPPDADNRSSASPAASPHSTSCPQSYRGRCPVANAHPPLSLLPTPSSLTCLRQPARRGCPSSLLPLDPTAPQSRDQIQSRDGWLGGLRGSGEEGRPWLGDNYRKFDFFCCVA